MKVNGPISEKVALVYGHPDFFRRACCFLQEVSPFEASTRLASWIVENNRHCGVALPYVLLEPLEQYRVGNSACIMRVRIPRRHHRLIYDAGEEAQGRLVQPSV